MLPAFARRWLIEAEDRLRYSPTVREVVGRFKTWRAERAPADDQARARLIRDLCAAARLTRNPDRVQALERRALEQVKQLDPARVDWTEFYRDADSRYLPRGVILKPWVGPREKGVVYVAFEAEWLRLVRHVRLAEFAERYTLIVAPSSSPYNLVNFVLPNVYPAPLYSLINHDEDVDVLRRVGPHYRIVRLYTSHWVNPAIYQPRPRSERDIDLLMVAAWGKVKRHHLLFRALRELPGAARVLLVGQDQEGRTEATVRREAGYYGVADRFEMWTNAPHTQVRDAFCRARASLLLSLREGSAVVVPESLFAGAPVGLLRNADNGSRAFITPQTGVFLDEDRFTEQLADFLARADTFAPREWAEANISCWRSSERLNAQLRDDMRADGQEWTRDLLPLCWQPDPRLVRRDDWAALQDERADIKQRYGVELGPPSLPE